MTTKPEGEPHNHANLAEILMCEKCCAPSVVAILAAHGRTAAPSQPAGARKWLENYANSGRGCKWLTRSLAEGAEDTICEMLNAYAAQQTGHGTGSGEAVCPHTLEQNWPLDSGDALAHTHCKCAKVPAPTPPVSQSVTLDRETYNLVKEALVGLLFGNRFAADKGYKALALLRAAESVQH